MTFREDWVADAVTQEQIKWRANWQENKCIDTFTKKSEDNSSAKYPQHIKHLTYKTAKWEEFPPVKEMGMNKKVKVIKLVKTEQ